MMHSSTPTYPAALQSWARSSLLLPLTPAPLWVAALALHGCNLLMLPAPSMIVVHN